jgi:mono/diheme cytochrome c family protein
MRIGFGWVAVAMLLPAAAQAASFADEMKAKAGKVIAQEQCASCHAVEGAGGGSDAAPSFQAIAAKRDTHFLRGFLTKPHGNMPPADLTTGQIDALAIYIESLKK